MKKFYESFGEMVEKEGYTIGFFSDRDSAQGESQFLNSRPEELPLIGIIPMTGEGIEADVDDLAFVQDKF